VVGYDLSKFKKYYRTLEDLGAFYKKHGLAETERIELQDCERHCHSDFFLVEVFFLAAVTFFTCIAYRLSWASSHIARSMRASSICACLSAIGHAVPES